MADDSIALGVVARWYAERRAVAQARSRAQDVPEAPTVVESSWRGADTTTRDLAVEANVLAELRVALMAEAPATARAFRWGQRTRVDDRTFVDLGTWTRATGGSRTVLLATVGRLIAAAEAQGCDLGDLVITVTPPTEQDATAKLQPHITVELRGVRS